MSRRKVKLPPEGAQMGDYEVGYRRPPKATRFQPGRSGNPKGRPRGRKNVSTILKDALYKPVVVTENGRKRKIPAVEALMMRMMRQALEGDLRAMDKITKLLPMAQAAFAEEEAVHAAGDGADPEADRALLEEFARMVGEAKLDEEDGS